MTDRALERWKCVPEEPTEEMLAELKPHLRETVPSYVRDEKARAILRKVLAAAPSSPALSGEAEEVVRRQGREIAEFMKEGTKRMFSMAARNSDLEAELAEARAALKQCERSMHTIAALGVPGETPSGSKKYIAQALNEGIATARRALASRNPADGERR